MQSVGIEDAPFFVTRGYPSTKDAFLFKARHVWWNFVSFSKKRIAATKADWAAGRFDKVFGDKEEFIPAPA